MVSANIFLFIFTIWNCDILFLPLDMNFKDYLLNQSQVQLSEIAYTMWPNNTTAPNYLSKKLHDRLGLTFTANDEILARNALAELGIKLGEISNKINIPTDDLTAKKEK